MNYTAQCAAVALYSVLLWHTLCLLLQQPPGVSELYQATDQVRGWYFGMSELMLVIGAITGIAGGLRVYANWQIGGNRHAQAIDSQVIGWFLSCLFLILSGIFIKALYGI